MAEATFSTQFGPLNVPCSSDHFRFKQLTITERSFHAQEEQRNQQEEETDQEATTIPGQAPAKAGFDRTHQALVVDWWPRCRPRAGCSGFLVYRGTRQTDVARDLYASQPCRPQQYVQRASRDAD